MRTFHQGKKLWGYVIGIYEKPKSNNKSYFANMDTWEAKIITNQSYAANMDTWEKLLLIRVMLQMQVHGKQTM